MTAGPSQLQLHPTNISRHWNITGTQLTVIGTRDGGFRLTSWPGARSWVTDAGLLDVGFARRCDLLAAVAAHAAITPIPSLPDMPAVRLCRQDDGTHLTDTADFHVKPGDPGQLRWKIIRVRTGKWVSNARTLRNAADAISFIRQQDQRRASRDGSGR